MARPASGQAPKKGKKNRKHGRNKKVCEQYRREGRQEKNRKRRIRRHLKRHPDDRVALRALQ
jgi:hypothetical protein